MRHFQPRVTSNCSEEQIKTYLEKTLGEAPRPQWGVSWLMILSGALCWIAHMQLLPLPPLLLWRIHLFELKRCWHAGCSFHACVPCATNALVPSFYAGSYRILSFPSNVPQVPNGWYSYVAELFSWALGRPVDEESCKKCAKREPGRRCAVWSVPAGWLC